MPSLLLNLSLCIHPFTFINEVLHLVSTAKLFISLLVCLVWHQLQHLCLVCVIKATPFQFIGGNIFKSCRTVLTNHTQPISHHITPLVINALGADTQTVTQTHIHTYQCVNNNNFKKPGMCGLQPCRHLV